MTEYVEAKNLLTQAQQSKVGLTIQNDEEVILQIKKEKVYQPG